MACTVYDADGLARSGQADPPDQGMIQWAEELGGWIEEDGTGTVLYMSTSLATHADPEEQDS